MKKILSILLTFILAFSLTTVAFADDSAPYTGTYKASDGGTLTISTMGNDENGETAYKVDIEGTVYDSDVEMGPCNVTSLAWRATDTTMYFSGSQFTYSGINAEGDVFSSTLKLSDDSLFKSADENDTSFYLVKANEQKSDDSTEWYDIIKVYKKVSGATSTTTAPATVTTPNNGVKIDTGAKLTVKAGKTYQFKITATSKPKFICGNGSLFRVNYNGQKGKDYFFKVTAVGKAGKSAGFYLNGSKTPCTVGTIS